MRQLGTFDNERDAERLAAWLVAQRIDAQAEEAGESQWAVWVRDEDHLPQAREALAHFHANPQDARYANAERDAAELRRRDEAQRRDAQKNVVQMRTRWGTGMPGMGLGGAPRRAPLALLLIAASVLTGIIAYSDTIGSGDAGPQRELSGIYRALLFADPLTAQSVWDNVARGQIWRLITPIFIHYSWSHIIFNLLCLYAFGTQIEDRRGSRFFLGLLLLLAVTSNLGQAVEASVRQMGAGFGGLSGVGYGLFGYLFVKTRYDNRDGYLLSPVNSFLAILWFIVCIARDVPPFSSFLQGSIPPIANSAHAVGLFVGAALAYVPIILRKPA